MATLYVVATPIGNLADMTYRAVDVLQSVDLVLCEDTRVTGKLLKHYDISVRTMSYHANSAIARSDEIVQMLQGGTNIALVSDAGTPCVSDPGVQLIQLVQDIAEVEVVAVPGASALTAALSIAGVSGNQFVFMGFVPHKKGRQTMFQEIAACNRPVVCYESPHRIMKTLQSLVDLLSADRRVIICRELTKMHEQVVRGSALEVQEYFVNNSEKVRGEFVIIVDV